jgi:hypothetical protein
MKITLTGKKDQLVKGRLRKKLTDNAKVKVLCTLIRYPPPYKNIEIRYCFTDEAIHPKKMAKIHRRSFKRNFFDFFYDTLIRPIDEGLSQIYFSANPNKKRLYHPDLPAVKEIPITTSLHVIESNNDKTIDEEYTRMFV